MKKEQESSSPLYWVGVVAVILGGCVLVMLLGSGVNKLADSLGFDGRSDWTKEYEQSREDSLQQEYQNSRSEDDSYGRSKSCSPAYPDFCIPPVGEAGDLDCDDIGRASFTVLSPDPHRFDQDKDGVGCEPWEN